MTEVWIKKDSIDIKEVKNLAIPENGIRLYMEQSPNGYVLQFRTKSPLTRDGAIRNLLASVRVTGDEILLPAQHVEKERAATAEALSR